MNIPATPLPPGTTTFGPIQVNPTTRIRSVTLTLAVGNVTPGNPLGLVVEVSDDNVTYAPVAEAGSTGTPSTLALSAAVYPRPLWARLKATSPAGVIVGPGTLDLVFGTDLSNPIVPRV